MIEGDLIRSLTLVVGPPDGLGAVPALKCILDWALIWQKENPDNFLSIQLIREISNSLNSLEKTSRLSFQYFPSAKRRGDNVFKGHSLTTAPLWSLTPISIKNEEHKKHFNRLSSAYLSWLVKAVHLYIESDEYEEWLLDSKAAINPAKPILSAAHEGALSIRKLVQSSSFELIEKLSINAWNNEKNTFSSILISLHPENEEHKRVKRLQSLFNLGNGFRPLHRRRSKVKYKEKVSNIKRFSNGIASTFHDVEIPDIGRGIIFTPILPSEDIHGEDTENISLVGVDFKSIITNKPNDKIEDKTKYINKLYAIASYKAKHIARANHFDNIDSRRIHPSELKVIDELLLNDRINISDRMSVLIILISGRSIENLQKKPALIILDENGNPTLQLTINKPKTKAHSECIQTTDTMLSPIPNRWMPVIRQFLSEHNQKTTQPSSGTSAGISRFIKKHIKKYSISITKLHRLLALSILDTTKDDGIASLLCDTLTSIGTTKNHYIAISKKDAVFILTRAWEHALNKIGDNEGLQNPPDQRGHIGSANVPDIALLRAWLNLKPANAGTWENEFFNYRKQIVLEGLVLAHRGVTDPNPLFVSDPNPDLKSSFSIVNDKDRGGKGQMSRLAVVPSKVIKTIREHNERTSSYTQGSQAMLYPYNARTPSPFLDSGSVIRPKELEKTEPYLPCPANGPRKLFRSQMVGKIPGEIVDAIMGWQTHGLVPCSEFSSLAPYMTMACSGKEVSEFYEQINNQEDGNDDN